MKSFATSRLGGLSLVLGALGFMAVFAFLAARFNYPDVLDGPAVAPIAALNNYLLPLWMIAPGVILLRHRNPTPRA